MGASETDGMKLPKYLRESGTDRIEIPKHMQEEAEPEVKEPAHKQEENETSSKPNYIENPLPLPKPHQKRVLDYKVEPSGHDDFDHVVDENDDFDIQ